jgi:hypothetical protein
MRSRWVAAPSGAGAPLSWAIPGAICVTKVLRHLGPAGHDFSRLIEGCSTATGAGADDNRLGAPRMRSGDAAREGAATSRGMRPSHCERTPCSCLGLSCRAVTPRACLQNRGSSCPRRRTTLWARSHRYPDRPRPAARYGRCAFRASGPTTSRRCARHTSSLARA